MKAVSQMQRLATPAAWTLHLFCFVLPLTTLAFAATGPHAGLWGLLFLIPLIVSVVADMTSPAQRRQPSGDIPAWPFDTLLYALVALQLVNIVLVARMISISGVFSIDAAVAALLVGVNSGYSAIVVAHELIHRSSERMRQLGRLLLCTVLYEHFYTEHIRGHHARVGTDQDPATALYDETFGAFFRRTVPAQWRSAWEIEQKRLAGDQDAGSPGARLARNRVLQGMVAEWALAAAIFAVFGAAAFVVFVAQAFVAVAALEAVNYFEHWGLRRSSRKVQPSDSWDTDSAFTFYTLVGLSRHADHHAYAARPYHQLRFWEESPKLPFGYFAMVFHVWARNDFVRKLLRHELRRRNLGPFAVREHAA